MMTMKIYGLDQSSALGKLDNFLSKLRRSSLISGPQIVWNSQGEQISKRPLLAGPSFLELKAEEYFQHHFEIPKSLKPQLRDITRFEITQKTPFELKELFVWVNYSSKRSSHEGEALGITATFVPKRILSALPDTLVRRLYGVTLLDENEKAKCSFSLPFSLRRRAIRIVPISIAAIALGWMAINYSVTSHRLNFDIQSTNLELELEKKKYAVVAKRKRDVERSFQQIERAKGITAELRIPAMLGLSGLLSVRQPNVHFRSLRFQNNELVVSVEAGDILDLVKSISSEFPGSKVELIGAISRTSLNAESATIHVQFASITQ